MYIRISKNAGKVRTLLVCLLTGVVLTFFMLEFSDISRSFYGKMLSQSWGVFAGWLPIITVVLTLALSNSNKKFYKEAVKKGVAGSLITDIGINMLIVFIATVALFIGGLLKLYVNDVYTFICSTLAIMAISHFAVTFYALFLLAKYSTNIDRQNNLEEK